MGDKKILYCPRCNRRLGEWDGRSITTKPIKCKKCSRLVLFNNGNFVRTEAVPKRNTASGMTFR